VTDQQADQTEQEATELVMKKEGSVIHVWAYVDGVQVFQASPVVTKSKGAVSAAVQTFISRAWEEQFNDLLEDDDGGRWSFR
jgi:hypothetical protein